MSSTSSMRRSASAPRQAVQVGVEAQVLLGGELLVEGLLLEDQADATTHLVALLHDVVAGHPGAAAGGVANGAQHLDRGGLPGAVGPQEAVGLAGLDAEIDALDGLDELIAPSVGLGEPVHADGRFSNGVRHETSVL
jgi:hypothetical protein